MNDFFCQKCFKNKHIKHLGETSKTHSHVKTCDSCVESREKKQRQFVSRYPMEKRNAGIDSNAKKTRERHNQLDFDLEMARIEREFSLL